MLESQPEQHPSAPAVAHWLVFLNRDEDDGPWLRLMVLNPLNGELCLLIEDSSALDEEL